MTRQKDIRKREHEDIGEIKRGRVHRGMPKAFRGEEGRNKLRKATGIGKYDMIRGYPNGGT